MNSQLKVSIVEDDAALRLTLARYLDTPGFTCLSTHANTEDALKKLPQIKPDVVLVDIHLPGRNGIECVAGLGELLPSAKCVILTAFEDTELIFQALSAGALGYLLKKVRPAKLLDAIREVHEGGSPMSSQIARKVVQFFKQPQQPVVAEKELSERELQVLNLLAQGMLYKQVASSMGIMPGTVRTYAQRLYEKLHVHSRTEAVIKFLGHRV